MKDYYDSELDLEKGGLFSGSRILIKIKKYNTEKHRKLFNSISSNIDKIFLILTENPVLLIGLEIPDNCIIGISCIDQCTFERRIEALRHINCKYRFVHFIPMDNIVFTCDFDYIDWAIIEGDSEEVKLMPFLRLIHILKSTDIPLFVRNNYLQFFDEKLKEFPEWMKD